MAYYIGQALGLVITAGAILTLQMKNKNQMLIVSAVVNIRAALKILLLDEFSSGVIINFVAVLQIILSLWHERKKTDVILFEKILFLILYIGGGAIGIKTWIDILSIVAAVLYMLAMFQKKEQHIRLFLLGNMSAWTVYHLILGSTAVFAQIAGICSSLIALFRYRKKEKTVDDSFSQEQNSDISGSDWMGKIDGSAPITALNIPGTHDSATKFCTFSLFSRTQVLDIEEQLYAGVRYFDMRFELRKGEFYSVHSISSCKASKGFFAKKLVAGDSVTVFKNFLEKNPGETVLFQLKEANSATGDDFFEKFCEKYIRGNEKIWFLENRTPTLDEARGKIVLLRVVGVSKEKFNDSDSGVNFRSYPYVGGKLVVDFRSGDISHIDNEKTYAHMYVQDSYKLSPGQKIKAIKAFMNEKLDKDNYNINMANCIGGIPFPVYTSRKVNADIAESDFSDGAYLGIVGLDFATDELCRKIYLSNKF